MDDNNRWDDDTRKHILCCDPNQVATILSCLCELKNTIACVVECSDDHSSSTKERIILCVLLDEIRKIEAKLDNPNFGLNEIKNEIREINDVVSNSIFGLREIKNEIIDIDSLLNNQFFGLNEIKNEIITINDLLTNTTFGIPELKNEIRIIENRTNQTISLLTNNVFGLNEIKNEIRLIENQTVLLTNNIFGINEIKNEIRGIENQTILLSNKIFGLNEIKTEIRLIENQTVLLTNDIFGLNEIKNEIRGIENQTILLSNKIFGLNEIKTEIRLIENQTVLLTNDIFGLNEIKNEIRGIENQTILLTNKFFGLNEIKNEIRLIENQTVLLTNNIFGLNEIKNEIRGIENQTILLTNKIFGLNEIKNEIRLIENEVRALNRPLTCATDSVLICGEEVGSPTTRTVETDKNNILITIPQSSAYTQINQTFAFPFTSDLSDTTRFYIKISNPVGSGERVFYLDRIFGGDWLSPTNQPLNYQSVINLSIVFDDTAVQGTARLPTNLNAGSLGLSKMLIETLEDTTIATNGRAVCQFSQVMGYFSNDFHGQIIVPPGHNLLISGIARVTNSTRPVINLTITWYELAT